MSPHTSLKQNIRDLIISRRLIPHSRALLRSCHIAYGYLIGRSIAQMEAPGTMRLVDIDQVLRVFRGHIAGGPAERACKTCLLLEELYAWNADIRRRQLAFSVQRDEAA